ncbi:MAG TPA: BBP7 family outer membrane beta-barrel protein [Lacipirellulaceae bacterium]|nr:BBP7 family outer membrane beta-barrel protein [Lacipirellulaceae bacterium]
MTQRLSLSRYAGVLAQRRYARVLAAASLALCLADAHAQSGTRAGRMAQPSDAPNRTGETDAAADMLVESLFEPFAPADPLPGATSRTLGVAPAKAARPKWSARLARNPHPEDGNAPYVLIDRYGGIQRYVEPVKQIDLSRHVGQTVAVRRDTGGTLLATQLELPRTPARSGAGSVAAGARPDSGVRPAAMQEPLPPLEPTPADGVPAMPLADQPPAPTGESIEGEVVEGPMMYHGDHPHAYEGGYEGYEEGMVVPDGVDPLYLEGHSELGGCTSCGDAVCGGRGCTDGCGFGSRPIFYARAEYLHWDFDGMNTPPLVVRGEVNNNGTPGNTADDFFDNATTVFGGNKVLDDPRNGGRFTLGYFLDDYGRWAIEGDYVTFGEVDLQFQDGGNGVTPIVGRPFIDATTGLPAVEDVSFPGIAGTVTVNINSEFQSAGVRFRRNLCCVAGCSTDCGDCVSCGAGVSGCDSCAGGASPACPMCPALSGAFGKFIRGGTRHVDVLYGFRYAQLDEGLRINEDLIADDDTTFVIDDVFNTSNEFFGGEIGFLVDWQRRRWSMEFLSKLAIGSTRQRVSISGQTLRDDQLFPNIGLLAQPSNVGTYERDEFSVIPEIGLTGGYQLTERLRFTLGYTLLYWSRVARPGDQIDLRVNPEFLDLPADPSLLPDPATIQPQSPEFVFRDTDIWAHGLSAGVDYSW